MQRLFSMFPPGLPGLALLLLRLSVAVALLLECYTCRHEMGGWNQIIPILLSLAIFSGYLTPLAALSGILFHGFVWLIFGGISIPLASIVLLDALALALLGPGAYSVDSFRFGRRIVVVEPPP
jgi:hypothetical protein